MGLRLNQAEWQLSKFSASLSASPGKFILKKNEGDYFTPDFSYLCPICLKSSFVYLPEESKIFWTNDFDLDHFPPKSVGGKDTVMVCKKCNSTAGYEYDNSIKDFLIHDGLVKRKMNSKINIKTSFQGKKGVYTSSLSLSKNNELLFDVNTKKQPLVKEWLEESLTNPKWEFKITIREPSINLVYKTFLKSAYLYCFSIRGYSFVYSNTGTKIRAVLNDTEKHILNNCGVFILNKMNTLKSGLVLINDNNIYKGYVVNLYVNNKENNHEVWATVLIPSNDSDSWEDLSRLQPLLDSKSELTFSGIQLIVDFKKAIPANLFDHDWNNIKNGNIRRT